MLTKEVYPKRLPFALFALFSEMVKYSLVTQNYITEQCSYWKLVPLDACFQLVQDAVDYFYNVSFAYKTTFAIERWGRISEIIVSLSSTLYIWEFLFLFVCGKTKITKYSHFNKSQLV